MNQTSLSTVKVLHHYLRSFFQTPPELWQKTVSFVIFSLWRADASAYRLENAIKQLVADVLGRAGLALGDLSGRPSACNPLDSDRI